ncbi:MAG TPA: tetratricopeptide repeat protein, partial [Chromatiales bacterium]|nr:tetratricopeptide repeat protein [Chromatiales bacterium]
MVRCRGCFSAVCLTDRFRMSRQGFLVDQALRAARLHHRAGNLAQAEKAYRQILEQDPSHAVALNGLGRIAAHSGHHEAAKELFERAIAARPAFPLAYKNLGDVLRAMRQYGPAISSYRQALALRPEFPAAQQGLAA